MLRSALEYAGYCLTTYKTPALTEVFIGRHKGKDEMKAQKEAFKIGAIRAAIGRYDAKLSGCFDELYQRSIDFGGHPNPHASFSAMLLDERDNQTGMTILAISNDPKNLAHAPEEHGASWVDCAPHSPARLQAEVRTTWHQGRNGRAQKHRDALMAMTGRAPIAGP